MILKYKKVSSEYDKAIECLILNIKKFFPGKKCKNKLLICKI